MSNVVRNTDTNVQNGVALGGATTVFAEGQPVMLPGMPVTPHACCGLPSPSCAVHCVAKTAGGSSTVFAEGMPIITSDDIDTCGDKRQTFAPTVLIGK